MKVIPILIVLVVLLSELGCKKDDDQYGIGTTQGVNVSDIIAINHMSVDSLVADSSSIATISVQLNPRTDSIYRNIIFSTNKGRFDNGTKTENVIANANGISTISILGNTTGEAFISVKAGQYSVDTFLLFTPALPDDFILSGSKFTGTVSDSFGFNCILYRNAGRGIVSDPIKVRFYITQGSSSSITQDLLCPPFGYSAGGNISFQVINPYQNTGTYTVHAKILSALGDSIERSVALIIH